MKCECCHKGRAATNFNGMRICNKCYIELMDSFKFYVGGKEVTEEEYRKVIEEGTA